MKIRSKIAFHGTVVAVSVGFLSVLALVAFRLAQRWPSGMAESPINAHRLTVDSVLLDAVASFPLLPIVLIILSVSVFILSGTTILHTLQGVSRELSRSLRREEDQRNLLDTSADLFVSVAPDGSIAYLNFAFERLTGWSRDEWMKKNVLPLFHSDDLPKVRQILYEGIRGERAAAVPLRLLTKAGEYMKVEAACEPLRKEQQIAGVLLTARELAAKPAQGADSARVVA